MLQEIVARSLGCDLGVYKHFVGSMHVYETDREAAQQYLNEAVQPRIEMPPMPEGDPWPPIRRLMEVEHRIRSGESVAADNWANEPYWADLIRLIQIFAATGDEELIEILKSAMIFRGYRPYIESRRATRSREQRVSTQPSLEL